MAGVGLLGVFSTADRIDSSVPRSLALSPNPNYLLRLSCSGIKSQSGIFGTTIGRNLDVYANLPETFSIGIANNWEQLYPRGSVSEAFHSGGLATAESVLTRLLGQTGIATILTSQVWTGSEPLHFEFPLVFETYSDPVVDVLTPIKNILMMASPYYGTNVIGSISNSITGLINSGISDVNTFFKTNIPNLGQLGGPASNLLTLLHAPGPTILDIVKAGSTGNVPGTISLVVGNSFFLDSVVITGVSIDQPSAFDVNGYPISCNVSIGLRSYVTYAREELLQAIWPDVSNLGGGIL